MHSGDFRYDPEMESPDFLSNFRGKTIDRMFVDTTFADPFWEEIPTKVVFQLFKLIRQAEAVEQVVDLITTYPRDTQVFIECDMLGTEEILAGIYLRTKEIVSPL